jgi:RimJ/RimL family protein N-acetyltransferase
VDRVRNEPLVIEPVTLRGQVVRLEPLSLDHVGALCEVGLEPELWKWIPFFVTTETEMRDYVQKALEEQARGVSLPFVVIDQASNQVIGCTRYGNIEKSHRRVEIGWTWYALPFQRTKANTEAKLLLLTHAFEVIRANRVELKTDGLNTKSRNAILRIGATEEGTFRRHMITEAGRVRDTVYFSIIDTEWPTVKANLVARLKA